MKRTRVDSSAVERAGYDPKEQILEIEFKGGHVYQYFDVPPAVYESLMGAESIGAFVNDHVKGVYEFVQL